MAKDAVTLPLPARSTATGGVPLADAPRHATKKTPSAPVHGSGMLSTLKGGARALLFRTGSASAESLMSPAARHAAYSRSSYPSWRSSMV